MHKFLFNPTPRQFFYLVLGYVIITNLIAYFLIGGLLTFLAIISSISLTLIIYQIQKQPKLKNKAEAKSQAYLCFIIPISLAFYLVFYSGILFREDFVTDKSQLQKVTGIIPQTYTHESHGSGKSRRSYNFLIINNTKLHCHEDNLDSCHDIYAYKDKTATVYYQPDTKNGNLVYEIIVDNQPIYEFHEQLSTLQNERKKENWQMIWAFILYGLPAIYLWLLYREVIEQLEEMDSDELQALAQENQVEINKYKDSQLRFKDFGIIGMLLLIVGILASFFMTMMIVVSYTKDNTSLLIISLMLLVPSIILVILPYKKANQLRNDRLAVYHNSNNTDIHHAKKGIINTQKIIATSDDDNPPSLLWRVARIIALIIMIPILLFFVLVAINCLIFKHEYGTGIFILIVSLTLAAGIKNIW